MDPLLLLLSGVAIVFVGILFLKLHPFFTLVLAAMFVAAFTSGDLLMEHWMAQGLSEEAARNRADQPFGLRVGLALGETCGKIGIVICMASIIGKCLLDSGAALKIVRSFLRTAGEKRAPAAMGASGFVLGIPVFFDTVFYLLVPLAKALGASTKKNYGLYVLAIIAGGTIAHSQVPPTPGPLFVAEQLNIDIGTMMLGGIIIGSFAATVGMVYAYIVNRKKPIPLRQSGEASEKDLPQWDSIEDDQLPGLWLSLTPIVLPLILLSGKTIFTVASGAMGIALPIWLDRAVQMLGDKNVALTLAASVGLYTLFREARGREGCIKESDAIGLGQWRHYSAHYLCRRGIRGDASTIGYRTQGGGNLGFISHRVFAHGISAHFPDSDGARIGYGGHDNLGGNSCSHGNSGGHGIPSPLPGHGHWLWFQALSLDERQRILDHQ